MRIDSNKDSNDDGFSEEGSSDVVSLPFVRFHAFRQLISSLPIVAVLMISYLVGLMVSPTWIIERYVIDASDLETTANAISIDQIISASDLVSHPDSVDGRMGGKRLVVYEDLSQSQRQYYQMTANAHYGAWSLLPASVAILLCWIYREPLTALLIGIASGALLLQKYDLTDQILLPSLATNQAAGIVILYLWLLGGLLGIWSKTGAAVAFANLATKTFVRGPRTAKLVAWGLGLLFFQGGSISSVLVGTTCKPIADREKVSHEELSYIVDTTASPVACLLAFNAWPSYVQALLFVPGVTFLASEASRIDFFFRAIPYSFYAIFAVISAFLLSIDRGVFLGRPFREAIHRSRTTSQLDRPGCRPMSFSKDSTTGIPKGYQPHSLEFVIPMAILILVAIGSFTITGTPQVRWGFGAALLAASVIALFRGMTLQDLVSGIGQGIQSVAMASVILLLAVTMGGITQQTGGGIYLVEQLGTTLPYWTLPSILFVISIAISFSTGTSWGTYAIAFPLAMPLATSISHSQGLTDLSLYLTICFACVLNGAVFGDHCSPISDTTLLSAMTTGSDLMDHVTTQIIPASFCAILATLAWTGVAFLCV